MKKKISLPMQILIALILGIVAGFACYAMQVPDFTTNYLKPFGDIFVNLLKFIVVPVVLLSMIDGILSMGDMKKVGSVGVKTLVYFMTTSAIACVIGLTVANLFNSAHLFPVLSASDASYTGGEFQGFMSTLVGIPQRKYAPDYCDRTVFRRLHHGGGGEGPAGPGHRILLLCGH